MEDKELISQLQNLRGIKPREEWVFSTKQRILGKEAVFEAPAPKRYFVVELFQFFRHMAARPAFVMPVLVAFVFGGIMVEQTRNSLPGDLLYPVKIAAEEGRFNLSSEHQAFHDVELAQRRLSELRRVVELNKTKNLPSTLIEFQASVERASKGLAELVEKEPEKALQISKEVVQLQNGKAQIEQILGTTIGEEESGELVLITKMLIENELIDLESRSLSGDQKVLFEQAKEAFEKEEYQKALESIWEISAE